VIQEIIDVALAMILSAIAVNLTILTVAFIGALLAAIFKSRKL